MRTEFLTRLYFTVSSEMGQPSKGRRLNELYEFTPDVLGPSDAIDRRLSELGAPQDAICNELSALVNAYEKQGFINGFRLGMMLQEELDVSKLDAFRAVSYTALDSENRYAVDSLIAELLERQSRRGGSAAGSV